MLATPLLVNAGVKQRRFTDRLQALPCGVYRGHEHGYRVIADPGVREGSVVMRHSLAVQDTPCGSLVHLTTSLPTADAS